MNTALDEVRRLRQELAAKDRELAELRGLVQQHIEATKDDEQRCLQRERQAHQRGLEEGRETGWRQGVEHALIQTEDAHLQGRLLGHNGQLRELGLHNGPVPDPATPEQRVALAERYTQLRAAQIARQWEADHPEPEADDRELEAG